MSDPTDSHMSLIRTTNIIALFYKPSNDGVSILLGRTFFAQYIPSGNTSERDLTVLQFGEY